MILQVTDHHRVDARRMIAWVRFRPWWWPFWRYAELVGVESLPRAGMPEIEWFDPKTGRAAPEGAQITRLVVARETFEAFTQEVTEDRVVPLRRARRK